MNILFLCHGNICRSPMAEFVMKDLLRRAGRDDVAVDSAALRTDELGSDIHRGTRAVLAREGIPFEPRAAWLFTAADAARYDRLIGMDAENMADLKVRVHPADRGKICKLLSFAGEAGDVADPWYTGDFDETYRAIRRGCQGILDALPERRELPGESR